jgi:hypothetical protein
MAQVVVHLPSKHEALSSNPSRKKERERKEGRVERRKEGGKEERREGGRKGSNCHGKRKLTKSFKGEG